MHALLAVFLIYYCPTGHDCVAVKDRNAGTYQTLDQCNAAIRKNYSKVDPKVYMQCQDDPSKAKRP